ncbi:unnamed protein product [Heligmosomoides polygyrus]|uniref:Uncharacterized protein n=1 Tax=Heligmosomoides polygyrus TaxID=6339 RepID=A0A3P8HH08_HELPZ|nr:unnamed protein product [Heligmosomoides polygyrus]
MYVVAPKHLRDTKIHKQLMINSQEIVTHHDLHSTFKDILYRFESNPRGSSLLRQFESGIKRTCKTLPIPFQYCICQFEREPVSDKTLLQALGRFAVGRLAATLDTHKVSSRCEKVSLGEVSAEKYVLPNQNSTAVESNLYDVTFTVVAPALGKFKIPIREEKGGHFELGGDQFNRLDKYGKHGDCMRTDILRPLCTCKK